MGGTIATNASGGRSFRYGATRAQVTRLRVVLAGGRVLDIQRGEKVRFRVPAIGLPGASKTAVGYPLAPRMDLIDLFIGSEGTLGVVTEAELRLLPAPDRLIVAVIFFPSEDAVLRAVEGWRAAPGLRAQRLHGPTLVLRPPASPMARPRQIGVPVRPGHGPLGNGLRPRLVCQQPRH